MASELRQPASQRRRSRAGALLLLALLAPGLGGARVYHSVEEALRIAFPEATAFEAQPVVLDDAARRRASELAGFAVRDRSVVLHLARGAGGLLGSALVLSEIGKTLPFQFLVTITPQGAVDQVLLLRYREPRGHEIERRGFRKQFHGKRLEAPIRRGRDIRNITGATLSVDALSRGVRRALALHAVVAEGAAGARGTGASARVFE